MELGAEFFQLERILAFYGRHRRSARPDHCVGQLIHEGGGYTQKAIRRWARLDVDCEADLSWRWRPAGVVAVDDDFILAVLLCDRRNGGIRGRAGMA